MRLAALQHLAGKQHPTAPTILRMCARFISLILPTIWRIGWAVAGRALCRNCDWNGLGDRDSRSMVGIHLPISRETIAKLTSDCSLSTLRLSDTGFTWDCDEGQVRQQMVDSYLQAKHR